ncbi:YcaO-like family protein [Kutzneria kofuensis]
MTGAEAWIGPLPSTGRAGWDDARLRLSLPEREDSAEPAPPDVAAVLADHVVHRVFREVTGLVDTDDVGPRLARFDLRTLSTTYHRVLPHPFAGSARPQTADEFRHTVNQLSRGPRLDEETFSRRAAELVDDRLGPFRAIGERDFAQLPLHVSEVTVADPLGLLGERRAPVPVIAAGPDFAAARHRAAVRAFAVHGSLFVDPRRLLAASDEPTGGDDPAEGLVALTAGEPRGRVWGTRLTDGEPCEVPVETVFPVLRSRSVRAALSAGATAGYDWAEAVTAGVAGRCLDLTVAELAGAGRQPLSVVDIRYTFLDEIGQRYRRLLAALDAAVWVYDATGSLDVPTYAFCLGTETVCYTSAPRVTDALRDGLEQVLLACQARMHGQNAYAPPPVPQLPPRLRGDEPARQRPDTGLRNMVEALCSNGRVPVAVPLDHDPEMSEVMPYAVQVVLR